MKTYLSILRGINVGGKNTIKMADLRKCFENAGFKNVDIYIQSGNIVFQDKNHTDKQMKEKVEKIIKDHFRLTVPVLIRNEKDWKVVLENNPFLKMKDINHDKLHVTFLSDEPDSEYLGKIKDLKFDPDQFVISGRTVYLYCPEGYGNTKINNTFFEKKLNLTATTRNWRTVNELMRMAEAIS
jgi:uncharacterized protein (DUF1697 family)